LEMRLLRRRRNYQDSWEGFEKTARKRQNTR